MENENIEYTFEDKMKKATDWLGKNLSGIFAFLISLFFVFYGMVEILPTNLGIKEQVITAFLTIFAGFSITSLVGEYGFTSAKNSKKFTKLEEEYDESVKKNLKYRGAIDEFARERATENLKTNRMYILEKANLYYYDIFNEQGELITTFDIMKYKNEKNFTKKIRAYNRAIRMKIINTNVFGLSTSSLFGVVAEESEKSYRTKKSAKSLIFKVLLGFASVGIMFNFIGFSWGAIIYAFMQVVLWVAFGLIDRQKNYNFVMDTLYDQIKYRKQMLDEFYDMPESQKQVYINKSLERKKTKLLQIEQKFDIKETNS